MGDYNWAGNVNQVYVDNVAGTSIGYASGAGNTQATDSINGMVGGNAPGAGGAHFPGDIAAVFVFQPALSATDRTRLYDYLNSKYNLGNPTSPLTKRINKSVAAVLSFVGNLATQLFHGGQLFTQAFTAALRFNDAPPTTGLKIWLEADSLGLNDNDPVTTWTDLSGNGFNATQVTSGLKPLFKTNIINGKSVVRFDGADDYLSIAALSIWNNVASGSIFVVCSDTNNGGGTADHQMTYWSNGTSSTASRFALKTRAGSTAFIQAAGRRLDTDTVVGSNGTFVSGFHVILGEANWSGGTITSYIDGTASTPTAYSSGAGNTSATDSLTAYIGGSGSVITSFFPGDIAAVFVYQPALSSTGKDILNNYLSNKYGITLPGVSPSRPLLIRTNKALTAGLSFVGSLTKKIIDAGFVATLSFAGGVTKRLTKTAFTAALSFIGNLAVSKSFLKAFTATLSFAGNLAVSKSFLRVFTATLSFSGALARRTSKNLTAVLSFAGATTKRIIDSGFTATLSFAGNFTKRTNKTLTAVLSFIGNLVTVYLPLGGNLFFQSFTATLSFSGTVSRRISKTLSATLSFAAAQTKKIIDAGFTATLSFAGTFTRSRIVFRVFTATLSFSGGIVRRTSKVFAAAFAPTATLIKRIRKTFAATLSFIGNLFKGGALNIWAGQIAGSTVKIAKTLGSAVATRAGSVLKIFKTDTED
jgi:hypothetical protein